jgi:hypothetical protein
MTEVNGALAWARVVRSRWLRAATGPLSEITDVRAPRRARSLLVRAERRAHPRVPASPVSPLPDIAVRQLRERSRGRAAR